MPAIDLSILNQRQTPAFYADVFANRPAAGFVGRIFVSTDTFAFYRDNGTGWDLIGGPGTGTITGSGLNGQIALWTGASTIGGISGLTYGLADSSLTASKFIVTGGTSSQFLKANGSLDSNTYNTGSGAVGQVTFWNGTNAITGNNNLFWDSVNGHLGIGTNVPGTALQIDHGQSQIIRLNQTTATNDTKIAFQNSGTALWRIGNSYNAGANDFGIFDVVGAFQPVTVKKTTGQVLIGTSTVGSGKLVVASSTGDNGVQIVGASAPSLRIDNAESGPTKRAGFGISTATNNFIQGSADRDFCIFNGSTTASPMLFGIYDAGAVNVQEAARISAARNFLVGGVVDSGQKLQISGTALITSSVTSNSKFESIFSNTSSTFDANAYLRLVNTGTSTLNQSVDLVMRWQDGTYNGTGGISMVRESATARGGKLVFQPIDASGNNLACFSITSVGELLFKGISNAALASAYFENTNGQFAIFTTEGGGTLKDLLLQCGGSAGAGNITLKANGNCLIGTSIDSGQKLTVNGAIRAAGYRTDALNGIVIPNNTATTIFTISGAASLYIIYLDLPNGAGSPTLYSAYAIISFDGVSARIMQQTNGTNLLITLSGNSVQATQITGGPNDVFYRYITIV